MYETEYKLIQSKRPETAEEAAELWGALVAKTMIIQDQLSTREVADFETEAGFKAWSKSAKSALAFTKAELALLKPIMTELNRARSDAESGRYIEKLKLRTCEHCGMVKS